MNCHYRPAAETRKRSGAGKWTTLAAVLAAIVGVALIPGKLDLSGTPQSNTQRGIATSMPSAAEQEKAQQERDLRKRKNTNTYPDIQAEDGSPIAFDLDGLDFADAFTDVAHGVIWTFYPNRGPVRMSWTNPDHNIAWLVYDRNANGKVDNASEMFGNRTWQPLSDQEEKQLEADQKAGAVKPFDVNGFRALAVYDRPENGGNGDGKLDASDAIWKSLRLCVDRAHTAELYTRNCQTMEEDGIKSISLTYVKSGRVDQFGNKLKYEGTVEMINPSAHGVKIYDVYPVFGK